MEQQECIQKIRGALFAINQNIDSTTILDDLDGWDSLGRLSLAAMLQESFGAMVDTKTLLNCKTVGHIIELVRDRLTV